MPKHIFSASVFKFKDLNIGKTFFSDTVLHDTVYSYISAYVLCFLTF